MSSDRPDHVHNAADSVHVCHPVLPRKAVAIEVFARRRCVSSLGPYDQQVRAAGRTRGSGGVSRDSFDRAGPACRRGRRSASGWRTRRLRGRRGPLPVQPFCEGTLEVLQHPRRRVDRPLGSRESTGRLVGTGCAEAAMTSPPDSALEFRTVLPRSPPGGCARRLCVQLAALLAIGQPATAYRDPVA